MAKEVRTLAEKAVLVAPPSAVVRIAKSIMTPSTIAQTYIIRQAKR